MLSRLILLAVVLSGCSRLRPIATAPTPATLTEYLRTHQRPTLRVTDSTGRSRWLYDSRMSGDTLQGLRTPDRFSAPVVYPVNQLNDVAAQEFSVTRTLGLLAGFAGALGLIALMMRPTVNY